VTGILISVVIGLLVNECCDVCPWCACKLVRWSAYRRYVDPSRACEKAEELAALIEDRPGKLLKLFTALGFTGGAILVWSWHAIARPESPSLPDPSRALPPASHEFIAKDHSKLSCNYCWVYAMADQSWRTRRQLPKNY
jgi:hypothetical protein